MQLDSFSRRSALARSALLLRCIACPACAAPSQDVVTIGIGTQNTTTNTVTGGIVLKELKLLEKYLPKTGKYKDIECKLDWQNFTSGPPVTNGMMANKLQIGMMGDYPLLVNGATGQQNKGNETQLVAIIAYNAFGSGNGMVVHKDSPVLRAGRPEGQDGLGALRLGRARHAAAGDAGARLARRLLEPGEPEPRGRHHQPAGKEDRRPRRLRALRRPAALPRLRAQDLRRRARPRCPPSTAWWCARTSPRSTPRSWSPTSRR